MILTHGIKHMIETGISLAKLANTPYAALESSNEFRYLEFTDNAPNKKSHVRLINPIFLISL